MERVVSVKPLPDFMLELTFSDGYIKIVNIRPFIGGGISDALLDEAYFRRVQIESGGGIYWPNGYDFCPNFLRQGIPAAHFVNA